MISFRHTVSHIVPFMWPKDTRLHLRLIISIFLIILTVLCNLYIPIVLKRLIDLLDNHAHTAEIIIFNLAAFYGLTWLAGQILMQLRNIIFDKILYHNVTLFTLNFFEHLLSLSVDFHANKPRGELLSSIEGTADAIFRLWNSLIAQVIPIFIQVTIATIIVYQLYGLQYGAILLITICLYLLSTYFTVEQSIKVQQERNTKHFAVSAYLLDALQNYELIKSFNQENYEQTKCTIVLQDKEDANSRSYVVMGYIVTLQMTIVGIGLLIMTVLATFGVVDKNLKVGDFVLLNSYLLQFSLPMSYFGYVLQGVRQSFTRIQHAIDILDTEPTIVDGSSQEPLNLANPEISFNHVYFGYDHREKIIQNMSFTIYPHTTMAIVGKTGCGKSSIVKLLLRLYDPLAGSIILNGINLKDLPLHSLRSAIALIPQDTAIFNRSIYENIIYGNPSASGEEINNVIHVAHLEELIAKLPDGLNTMVGERGLKLSGGERQRIAIARAVLKKAPFYIFDEATSALDLNTERIIQNNLAEVSKGVTALIIAHRLSTVIHAEAILVMDAGMVVERGTHLELLRFNGIYAKMWFAQQQEHP